MKFFIKNKPAYKNKKLEQTECMNRHVIVSVEKIDFIKLK